MFYKGYVNITLDTVELLKREFNECDKKLLNFFTTNFQTNLIIYRD